MNYKALSYVVLSAFTAILVLASVSAFSLSGLTDFSLSKNSTAITFSSSASESPQTITIQQPIKFVDSANNEMIVVPSSSQIFLNTSSSQTVTLSAPSIPSGFRVGSYSTTLFATSSNSTQGNQSLLLTFTKGLCKSGSVGSNLTINRVRIRNTGSEDLTWLPLDEVTIEVRVDNDADVSIRDVNVEVALYDSSGRNAIGDMDFISADDEKVDIGRISSGESESTTFEFKVPADFETGNYRLFVKAYSDDLGESKECVDMSTELSSNNLYTDISIDSEDDEGKFIAFDNIELSQNEAVCGDSITLDFDVLNVGRDDQDQVKIILTSNDLGLDLSQEINSGLNQGDKKEISFTFTVPEGLQDKTYTLLMRASYDYRSGSYRQSSDEQTEILLKVFGCTPVTTSIASIVASLASNIEAGKDLIVNARVTNTGISPVTFVIDASGYSPWSSLTSITPRTLALGAGESGNIVLTFKANDDVSGDKSFNIDVKTADKTESETVKVVFPVVESTSFSLGDNWLLWVIGLINVLLIVVIIIVAIRVSQR